MLPFRTILVAADFSESSRNAFRLACSIARDDKSRLVVLHVIEPILVDAELGMPFPLAGGERAHHESLEKELRAYYAPDGLNEVEYRTRDGLAAEEILRVAKELGCDLVVMGTHGRTGLNRLLSGSVAEAVLRKASCPVLFLRSHGRAPSPESEGLARTPSTDPERAGGS